MRPLLAFLSLTLATCTIAIPLHKGETWTWKIVSASAKPDTVTATILDSAAFNSDWTSCWRMAITTSHQQMDTATILSSESHQIWQKTSSLIPWTLTDAAPWQNKPMDRFSPPQTLVAYGDFYWVEDTHLDADPELYQGIHTWTTSFAHDYVSTVSMKPRPRGLWDSAHGLLHYQNEDETWTLLSHNSTPVALPPPGLRLPPEGSSWTWSETESIDPEGANYSITDFRKVRIIERPADSAQFARISVLDILGGASLRFDCRIPRLSPERFQGCPEYVQDWIVDWRELPSSPNEALAHVRDSSELTSGHIQLAQFKDVTIRQDRIREDGIALSKNITTTYAQEDMHGAFVTKTKQLKRTVLVELNGVALALRIEPTSHKSAPLLPLLRKWPEQAIPFHDISGRSGKIRAGDLLKPTTSQRILFLKATFPDGSRWQGKYLTGKQHEP